MKSVNWFYVETQNMLAFTISYSKHVNDSERSIRSLHPLSLFRYMITLMCTIYSETEKSLSVLAIAVQKENVRFFISVGVCVCECVCMCVDGGLTSFSHCLTQLGCVCLSLRCLNSAVFLIWLNVGPKNSQPFFLPRSEKIYLCQIHISIADKSNINVHKEFNLTSWIDYWRYRIKRLRVSIGSSALQFLFLDIIRVWL